MPGKYEWVGLDYRKPTLPPYRAERRPYDECPNCGRFEYRPIFDGRTGDTTAKCKSCKFARDAVEVGEPDIYVEDPTGAAAVAGVLILLWAVGMLIYFGASVFL